MKDGKLGKIITKQPTTKLLLQSIFYSTPFEKKENVFNDYDDEDGEKGSETNFDGVK